MDNQRLAANAMIWRDLPLVSYDTKLPRDTDLDALSDTRSLEGSPSTSWFEDSSSSCNTFSTVTSQDSSPIQYAVNGTVSYVRSGNSIRNKRQDGIRACESCKGYKLSCDRPARGSSTRCLINRRRCIGHRFTGDTPSKSDAEDLKNTENLVPYLPESMSIQINDTQLDDYQKSPANDESSLWQPIAYPIEVTPTLAERFPLHGLISPLEWKTSEHEGRYDIIEERRHKIDHSDDELDLRSTRGLEGIYSSPHYVKASNKARPPCAPLATNSSLTERNPNGKSSPYSTQSHDGESESCLETDIEVSDYDSESSGSLIQHPSKDPLTQFKKKFFGEVLRAFWDIYNKEYASIISQQTISKVITRAEKKRLWESHKEEIYHLYVTEQRSLDDTMKIMTWRHGIDAPIRSWEGKLKEWNYQRISIGDKADFSFLKWLLENNGGQNRALGERDGKTDDSTSQLSVSTSLLPLASVASSGKRKIGSEESPEENDDQGSREPNEERAYPPINRLPFRYACPFRKHNPRRYNIHHFQRCALGCFSSIARLKEHLYRRHIAPIQCVRCWLFFKAQDDLNAHMTANNICDRRDGQPAEGITPSMEKKLRKRTRLSGGQKDEDRWRDIYQMIFPGEEIPSPFFEPVQDEAAPAFETSDISFEEFLRQEVPDIFTSRLKTEIKNMDLQDSGLLDDPARLTQSFVTRLRTMIVEAQDAAIQSFRQRFSETTSQGNRMLTPAPSSSSGSLATPMQESQGTSSLTNLDSRMIPEDRYLAPPPSLSQDGQESRLAPSSTDILVDEDYQPKRKRKATDEAVHSINYTQSGDNGFISHNFQEDTNFDASYFLQSNPENDIDWNGYDWPFWDSKTTESQEPSD